MASEKMEQIFPRVKEFIQTNWVTLVVILVSLCASGLSAYFTFSYANQAVDALDYQLREQVIIGVQNNIIHRIEVSAQKDLIDGSQRSIANTKIASALLG